MGLAAAGSLLLNPRGFIIPALAVAALAAWPSPVGPPTERRRAAAGLLLLVAIPINLVLGGQLDGHLLHGGDFRTYFVGAETGLRYGWSHLYDPGLQVSAWSLPGAPRVPFLPFLNVPIQAWLVVPLTALGYQGAYWAWVTLVSLVAGGCVLLVAGDRPARASIAAVALALWVVPYTLASGQNAVLAALAVVLCWRFLRAGREGLAGLSLWLMFIRPNPIALVPIALLAAGHRRAFATWALGALLFAGATLLSLGEEGVRQFLALSTAVQAAHPLAHQMTLAGIIGGGPVTVALQAVLVGGALVAASRARSSPGAVVALGVLASLLGAVYIHQQDYIALLVLVPVLWPRRVDGPVPVPAILLVLVVALAPPGWAFGGGWEWMLVILEVAIVVVLSRSGSHPSGPATPP